MPYIKRDAKEFRNILNTIGYRKRSVQVCPSDKITVYGLNWDGGSRSEYTAVTLDGKPVGDLSKYNMVAPWQNPANGSTLPIPPGVVVIKHGVFMGKPATAYIYVNPADMPALLAA